MRIKIAAFVILFLTAPSLAQTTLTATEIFELRTKCQAEADNVAKPFIRSQLGDQSINLPMQTPDGATYIYLVPPKENIKRAKEFSVNVVSNLDMKTLHCYALITLDEIAPRLYPNIEKYIHLFDAQTRESLAFIFENYELKETTPIMSSITDQFAEKSPIFKSFNPKDDVKRTEEVLKYIKEKMNPNR